MDKLIESFSKSLPDYLRDIEKPSGKLFYDLCWSQIDQHIKQEKQRMLDIGCGFGLTSIRFSEQGHEVTGIDITPDMIDAAEQKAKKKQLDTTFTIGKVEDMERMFKKNDYDWLLCHNILGYVNEPKETIGKLAGLLKQDGYLSLISHNPAAKVMKAAIVEHNFRKAKEEIGQEREYNTLIGAYVNQYPADTYLDWMNGADLKLAGHYGIRCVYDYITKQGNQPEEYQDMLSLELELGSLSPYRDIAFFTHLIVQKQ
jgi:S-adenosylmethionine-dependent methyltransferase